MIGETLGHYEIIGHLGKGGMGEVYRAADTRLGREVALKVLPRAFAEDAERLSRFEREARVLASLSHPNIAAIHGFEEADGHHFLVLELVPGENLARRLAHARLEIPEILRIAIEVARGLESAHQKGIVHRDLKPANIQLGPDGTVKILDFGLARAFEGPGRIEEDLDHSPTITAAFTTAGTILGTAAYMSPEQVRGQEVDARGDIWSFGCVLYEMLSGKTPAGGTTAQDVMAAILEREPDWGAVPAETPSAIRVLLERCLRKDPARRLHSIADARIELEEALVSGAPGPFTGPSESPRKIRPLWLALASVVFFAVGALAVRLLPPSATPVVLERAASPARYSLATPTPIVALPLASSVAIAPGGEYVVYVALGKYRRKRGLADQVSHTMLYVRPVNDFEAIAIDGTSGASSPFISPDGKWIGFKDSDNGLLKKVARAGGAPVTISSEVDIGDVRGASWSPDGQIYLGTAEGGLFAIDAAGGEPRALTQPNPEIHKTHRFPHVLPDGRHVLFTLARNDIASYDDSSIALYSVETGDIRILVEGGTNPRYVNSGHIVFGRAGDLLAVPFDLETLEVQGAPRSVLTGVITSDGYGSAHYSVSDEGTLVYVPGGPTHYQFDLFVLDLDGRVERVPLRPGTFGDVAVSPDGTKLALSELGANANLWIYEIERGVLTRLTGAWDNYAPVWHPDGTRVVYASNNLSSNSLLEIAVDGSGQRRVLVEDESQPFPGSWSHDGRDLAYTRGIPGRGTDVWILEAATGETRPAVATPAMEFYGSISPNGNYLAYVSNESGQPEIYVQPLPVTGRRWRLSEAGGDSPRWAPDGRSLYFWSRQELMVVPLEIAPDFEPHRAQPVLTSEIEDMQSYDIFPDGKRFAVIGRFDPGEQRSPVLTSGGHRRRYASRLPDIRVVLDWFVELPPSGR